MHGSADEAEDFINWLCDLDYQYKLFTCGNHDFCMYLSLIHIYSYLGIHWTDR